MFLGLLKKDEKAAFLKLAHHVGRSDGDFSEKQQEIISTYCFEMQIADTEYNENEFDLDTVLKMFDTSKSQKIVLLEIMALVYSDNILHQEEKKIIDRMLELFGLNEAIATVYSEWTKAILAIAEQGKALIEI